MKDRAARFIVKWLYVWYIITAIFYAAAIPFTIIVFPDNDLILSVIVLFSGFTGSIAALASVLVDASEKAEQTKPVGD